VQDGLLHNAELFLFTANTLVESAFHKSTTSSKRLFPLILRLHKLQMEALFLHAVHIEGCRMCAQGTDGLSHAQLLEGDFNGLSHMYFMPLHLTAIDQESSLCPSLKSWVSVLGDVRFLSPFEWFMLGHANGNFVWRPPPAAAEAALEQLATALHK
jgi:hypothetical protein